MKKEILKSEYIFLDQEIGSQNEAFKFIAEKAKEFGLVSSKEALVKGYKNREAEGSTGFEDGFAIPHARIKEVKEAAIFVLRFKKAIDWNSMDGKPTKVAIALLIPDGPSGEEHLSILSDIAMKLMDENFKVGINNAKTVKEVLTVLSQKPMTKKIEQTTTPMGGLKIVAITSCITGIAHTYMAEEKLLQELPKMGHSIRVETQGSKGVGTPLKAKEIEEADLVIFATDTAVDKARFAGKKVYQTKVGKAIKDPQGTVKAAIEEGYVLNGGATPGFETKNNTTSEREGVMKHIMAGISYMIPVIVMGGIALAFSIGIAKAIWGPEAGTAGPNGEYAWGPLAVMDKIGGAAFAMMIPILAGFIANSIGGRAAIAPAMVGAFIGNNAGNFMPLPGMSEVQTPAGFLGAIAAGLMAGYAVKYINTWRVHKTLQAAMPIFFIPITVGLGIGFLFIYVIGGPIGYVMDQISQAFTKAYSSEVGVFAGLALGAALGAMAGFDMGGPINKIAFVTGSALAASKIYQPMGAVAAAIPVAPLAMGLTTIIVPKFFDKDTRSMGIAAIIMGTIGISEGAIPFAIRDPKRAVISNVLGSAVAGAIAGALLVENAAAHGGPIVAILGAVPYGVQTLYFFMAIAAGVAVTTAVYSSWLLADAGKDGSVKQAHVANLMTLVANKKDLIAEIKEESVKIKNAKREAIKSAKLANENAEIVAEEFDKKLQGQKALKANVIDNYKNQVQKSKEAYKVVSKQEKEFMNTKKDEVKEFNINNLNAKKVELDSLKHKIQTLQEEKNKLIKKQEVEKLFVEKNQIKENAQNKNVEFQTNLRKDFVASYNQTIS